MTSERIANIANRASTAQFTNFRCHSLVIAFTEVPFPVEFVADLVLSQ